MCSSHGTSRLIVFHWILSEDKYSEFSQILVFTYLMSNKMWSYYNMHYVGSNQWKLVQGFISLHGHEEVICKLQWKTPHISAEQEFGLLKRSFAFRLRCFIRLTYRTLRSKMFAIPIFQTTNRRLSDALLYGRLHLGGDIPSQSGPPLLQIMSTSCCQKNYSNRKVSI